MRREKEMMQVITNMGGIANVSSKEFYEAHAAVVEQLMKAGEAVSTRPGSRIDKRTVETTLKDLESNGQIKLLTTAVTSATGTNRQIRITYLTDTPEEDIRVFLDDLSRSQPTHAQPQVKTLDEPVPYGGGKTQRVARPQASLILLNTNSGDHDKETATKLLQADEETIRASLLTEPNTVVQLYGFIVGKIARAKELHMQTLRAFDEQTSGHVVSTEQRVLHSSYFFQDLPISVYSAVVSCRVPNQELRELLSTPEGRATPVGQLPATITETFELNKSRSRTRMMDIMLVLQNLGLVTPLFPSNAERPWLRCAPNGAHPTSFDLATSETNTPAQTPQYWHFNPSVPIHLWNLDDASPPYWKNATVHTHADGVEYWEDLRQACLDEKFANRMFSKSASQSANVLPRVSSGIVKLLRRETQWRSSYTFSWFQKQYLKQQTDVGTAMTPLQDADGGESRISRIADVISAPKDEVRKFFETERTRMLHEIQKAQKRNEGGSRRKAEEKANLAQKAAEAKAQREQHWQEMVQRVHPEPLKGTVANRVKNVKARFMQSTGTDVQKWEAELTTAVEEARVPAKRATGKQPFVPHVPTHAVPGPAIVPGAVQEKSIEDLIARQGPALEKSEPKPKKKKGEKGARDSNSYITKVANGE